MMLMQIVDVIRKAVQPTTRNYVVFDDKLISILKKYGLPISAAGVAALSQLHPEEAQAQGGIFQKPGGVFGGSQGMFR
jgi:hypothetical protein